MDLTESVKIYSKDNIVIKVEKLKVWTKEEKSWWRRKPTNPSIVVLDDLSVSMKTGEFVAVIGPSGAGKTTYLISLAGKCTLPNSGTITINGTNIDRARGMVEIVPQFDVFLDSLTVEEHLVFMTEMKRGSIKNSSNRTALNSLMHELKLKILRNSQISSLSGGERRLLSLATSLLSNPQILICDEPTTGLDSYNASLVVGALRTLSICGKIVVCSIHQPSSDLFKEFSFVTLMAEGKLLFHGSQENCKDLFERLNLRCPQNYNPAEFYIKAVSLELGNKNYDLENNVGFDEEETGYAVTEHLHTCQRNWFKQVQLLLWRSSLNFKRNIKGYLFQLLLWSVMSSIIIGTCYVGISGTTQNGVQDLRGFLWLMCSEVSFGVSYRALYAFESDLLLFKREVGIYSASSFYVSRFVNLMPSCVVWPIAYVAIATAAVQLPNYLLTAFKFALALIAIAVASSAYGLGMGALFISTGIMGDVMPCADLPLFLMSGAFLRISSLPLWLYPLKYFSHFYFGMDALSNVYWRQIDWIECSNSTSVCLNNGAAVLKENGYSNNFIIEDTLGLICVTAIWSLLGFYGLKREENKGYAY